MRFRPAAIIFPGVTVLAVAAISQIAVHSVSDGVFTAQQADRGKASYATNCAVCHGDQLEGGGESGPSLSGDDFTLAWGGHTIAELVNRIHDTMPANEPGKLSRDEVTAITAFILASNKFPPGSTELPSDPQSLSQIRIDAVPHAK